MFRKSFVFTLMVVLILAVSVYGATAQEPQAELATANGGCVVGAAYDPACDVDHNGTMNIEDLMLVANHWGLAGVWTGWITTGNDIYYNFGNVGIGTTSPGAGLDLARSSLIIRDSAGATTQVRLESQSTVQPGIGPPIAGGESQLVLSNSGADTVVLRSGRTGAPQTGSISIGQGTGPNPPTEDPVEERVRLDSNGNSWFNGGNVGIGTTAPGADLEVVNNTNGSDTVLALTSNIGSWTAGQELRLDFTQQGGAISRIAASNFGTGPWGLNFYGYNGGLDSSPVMSIQGGGNVGIGTTNPQLKLHVERTAETPAANDIESTALIALQTSNDMVDGFGPFLAFGIEDSAEIHNQIAGISAIRDGADDSGQLQFGVKNAGTWDFDAVVIDKSSNVGIGTTSPGEKLSVNGTIESTTGGFKFPDGTVQTTAGGGPGGGSIGVFARLSDSDPPLTLVTEWPLSVRAVCDSSIFGSSTKVSIEFLNVSSSDAKYVDTSGDGLAPKDLPAGTPKEVASFSSSSSLTALSRQPNEGAIALSSTGNFVSFDRGSFVLALNSFGSDCLVAGTIFVGP